MPVIFEMPSLSPTMEKGNLVTWCKDEGDEISVGDIIAEIDTDKATMEVESMYKGILAKILVPAGTHDVPVRTPIAVIRQKKDTDSDVEDAISKLLQHGNTKDAGGAIVQDTQEPEGSLIVESESIEISVQGSNENNDVVRASPLAKRLANEYGIDLSSIIGTGPHGRIVKQDVLSLKQLRETKPSILSGPKFVDEPMNSMRKVIAEKLSKVKREVPHFYMSATADITLLLELRRNVNDSGRLSTRITINDLVVKAVALAMRDVPSVNVAWNNDGTIRKFETVDVSVAVAVEDGLMTPIIWSSDVKPLEDISKEIKDLAKKAKDGKLKPNEFLGGGITVSNLGMFGIDSFLSIINPPQGSILSVGPARRIPVYNDSGSLVPSDMINIGYAVDHRVIDGGNAARFLETVVHYLENPILLFI